jgi:hypothetical protein
MSEPAMEDDLTGREMLRRLRLQRRPLWSVADDGQPQLRMTGGKASESLDQRVDAFALNKPANEQEPSAVNWPRREQIGVNTVRDDADRCIRPRLVCQFAQIATDGHHAGGVTPHPPAQAAEQ